VISFLGVGERKKGARGKGKGDRSKGGRGGEEGRKKDGGETFPPFLLM
jgi:hypothetical protein